MGFVTHPNVDLQNHALDLSLLGGFLLFYFVSYFCSIAINAVFLATAAKRLGGESCSIAAGIAIVKKRIGALVSWAAISAVIGVILHGLERSHNMVADIIVMFIGFAWALLSYFVLPILVLQGVGPMEAIKRSKTVFTSRYGRVIGANAVVGIVILVLVGLGVAVAHLPLAQNMMMGTFIFLAVLALLLMLFSASLNQVVKAALYLYFVEKKEPVVFSKETIDSAIRYRTRRRP